jgi:hypothetical protein
MPSLLLSRSDCLQTHPSGEIQIRIQQNSSMGDAANRQSQQSPQSHSIHGGSPQSTLNSPTTGALHTLQQNKTRKHKSPTETKTTHLSNVATTKSAWCCPSERHPTPSLLHCQFDCLQTHPSGEIQVRIQQEQFQWEARYQQVIAAITLDTWKY